MIWGTHDGPIRNITAALTRRVAAYFARKYPERDLHFYTAMTYGNPALKSILNRAQDDGCSEFLLIPLYPQYAGATTGAVFDKWVAATMIKLFQISDLSVNTTSTQNTFTD